MVECDTAQADVVVAWLKWAVLDGMVPLVNSVPVEVEAAIGRTWAEAVHQPAALATADGAFLFAAVTAARSR